ncbi:antibiotic biosynthesis monooxygenase family protein [Roseomonas marmotae]|uniref:Antibiotic biosynthesis monooxygenase n=1 Tax=Roseomonas marmotae TaxID=2768161 RepID=A0ABS3KK07_9PROT|nr:antibiotic biosynthesis monooxygenase [Roseomonas marmotae]MBO1077327.1 antibiotic biosynthesis monooxygenase [Roseomonas marmotae]QTI81361.1 antibiotic biosynthesis monooxygenase [Roseomonas marmotae]
MTTELALLLLRPGSSSAFVAAFADVAPLLTSADGYIRHRLVPALEDADLYLLTVDWRDVAAHKEGFEPSEAHARFMARLEPFLSGNPVVLHVEAGPQPGSQGQAASARKSDFHLVHQPEVAI